MEGAGVKLNRVFGYYDTPQFDPFLMLDDFRSDNPDDYIAGFPWHPHRGIETITYLLKGSVEHADSMGNKGVIAAGDVQWMTAGSGIIHQEMPKVSDDGKISGFQLWANLPASHKMMKPRYQDIKSVDIPEIITDNNSKIRVVCGNYEDIRGPVTDIITSPVFFDVNIPQGSEFRLNTPADHKVFCYVVEGAGYFCDRTDDGSVLQKHLAVNQQVLLFVPGDEWVAHTRDSSLRFLFLSGHPLDEPIAWHGPIVMNTQAEIETALNEYRSGTFIK